MKTFIIKSLSRLSMLVGLLSLLAGCAPGVNIFKTGYWGMFLVLIATVGIGAFVVFRISNSGAEHKG